jgi:hypothetical protein
MWIFIFFVNLAAASPWLRRSWSPNYSVLVIQKQVFLLCISFAAVKSWESSQDILIFRRNLPPSAEMHTGSQQASNGIVVIVPDCSIFWTELTVALEAI